jgi:hypothetical protein
MTPWHVRPIIAIVNMQAMLKIKVKGMNYTFEGILRMFLARLALTKTSIKCRIINLPNLSVPL